jgi:hypothetical protein
LGSENADDFQEDPQGAEKGNADGDREHADGEAPLTFIAQIEFVCQTVDGRCDLLEALIDLLEALIDCGLEVMKIGVDLLEALIDCDLEVMKIGVDLLEAPLDLSKLFVDLTKLFVDLSKLFVDLTKTLIYGLLKMLLPFPELMDLVLEEIEAALEVFCRWNHIGNEKINAMEPLEQFLGLACLFVFLQVLFFAHLTPSIPEILKDKQLFTSLFPI